MTQRVAVVSGGGTGIGRAIARRLASGGMHVVITGRRADVVAQTAAQLTRETGRPVVGFQADVGNPDDVAALVAYVGAHHDRVDALVCNAGGASGLPTGTLHELASEWRRTFDQNVLTAVLLVHGFLPSLARPGGRIILIGSNSTKSGGGIASYAASKAALGAWVLNLAAIHGRDGITANVVSPGYTPDTELFGDGLPQELHDRIVSRTAVGRAGTSADVAAAVGYLVSPEASFVTGQVLEVTGGSLPPTA
jgi:3-oxoacyl-[acyl-carrier protein] reductase